MSNMCVLQSFKKLGLYVGVVHRARGMISSQGLTVPRAKRSGVVTREDISSLADLLQVPCHHVYDRKS